MKQNNLKSLLPTISMNIDGPTVTFDSIPFWEGVQKSSGVQRSLPFSLTATNNGPIRQIASENAIMDVVNAYQSDEYSFITPPPGASAWADSLGEGYVNSVKDAMKNCAPKNILEIGGGSTWIASKLKAHFKPNSYILMDPSVRDSAEGVEVILDYFPSQKIDGVNFDLVLGFNVLEHVPDPLSFLRSIRSQLTSNGKVILVYPDCERQLLQGDINVLVHEHLSYFTEKSSRMLASVAGFNVLALSSENDTLMVVLEASKSSAITDQKFNELKLLQSCADSFQDILINTANKIKMSLDKNQFVGFHGATNGLNIFFYITGLGSHPNIRLYDGDVSKKGFYLPACSAPINSPTERSYAENSLLVISAMSYFKQIKNFATEIAGLKSSQILPLVKN